MKKIKSIVFASAFAITILFSGCYGPFKLTHSLYEWNGSVGDKWANSLVFFALNVIPVYGVATTVDALILNTIEFWTGDNPMGMKGNEKIEKIVENENGIYKITAKRYNILIEGISGADQGKKVRMKIDEENRQLFLEKEGELIKIAEFDELAQIVRVFNPDGSFAEFNPLAADPMAYVPNE